MIFAEHQQTRIILTPENLPELGPKKDQIEIGHTQILPEPKTKAWVDEQNKINIEKTLGYDRSYDEAMSIKHPNPQPDVEPLVKTPKRRDTAITLEKEKDYPQPSHALQEFVKHIANPLVDKGWNLHLKFGKGEPQGEQFVQGSLPHGSP